MLCNSVENEKGINIDGQKIIIYDVTTILILGNDTKALQRIVVKLEGGVMEYGVKINVGETTFVRINNSEKMTDGK